MDAHEGLAHDVQARRGEKAVDVGHAAVGRVFHRQHGEFGAAAAHRFDHVLERPAGQGFHVGTGFVTGLVRVGAGFPLEGDASGHLQDFPANSDGRLVAGLIPCRCAREADT